METSIEMNPLLDVPETEEVKIDLDTTTTLSMHSIPVKKVLLTTFTRLPHELLLAQTQNLR